MAHESWCSVIGRMILNTLRWLWFAHD